MNDIEISKVWRMGKKCWVVTGLTNTGKRWLRDHTLCDNEAVLIIQDEFLEDFITYLDTADIFYEVK